eukprot:2913433-Amphidinium_carterae.1
MKSKLFKFVSEDSQRSLEAANSLLADLVQKRKPSRNEGNSDLLSKVWLELPYFCEAELKHEQKAEDGQTTVCTEVLRGQPVVEHLWKVLKTRDSASLHISDFELVDTFSYLLSEAEQKTIATTTAQILCKLPTKPLTKPKAKASSKEEAGATEKGSSKRDAAAALLGFEGPDVDCRHLLTSCTGSDANGIRQNWNGCADKSAARETGTN